MDLPDRFNARITSRMGVFHDRLTFKYVPAHFYYPVTRVRRPYTIKEMQTILEARLGDLRVLNAEGAGCPTHTLYPCM